MELAKSPDCNWAPGRNAQTSLEGGPQLPLAEFVKAYREAATALEALLWKRCMASVTLRPILLRLTHRLPNGERQKFPGVALLGMFNFRVSQPPAAPANRPTAAAYAFR